MFRKIVIAGGTIIMVPFFLLLSVVCSAVITIVAILITPLIPALAGLGAVGLADRLSKKLRGRKSDDEMDFNLLVIGLSLVLFPVLVIPVTLVYVPVVAIVVLVVATLVTFGGSYFSVEAIVDYCSKFFDVLKKNENNEAFKGTYARLPKNKESTDSNQASKWTSHFPRLFGSGRNNIRVYNLSDEEIDLFESKESDTDEDLNLTESKESVIIQTLPIQMPIYKTSPPHI